MMRRVGGCGLNRGSGVPIPAPQQLQGCTCGGGCPTVSSMGGPEQRSAGDLKSSLITFLVRLALDFLHHQAPTRISSNLRLAEKHSNCCRAVPS